MSHLRGWYLDSEGFEWERCGRVRATGRVCGIGAVRRRRRERNGASGKQNEYRGWLGYRNDHGEACRVRGNLSHRPAAVAQLWCRWNIRRSPAAAADESNSQNAPHVRHRRTHPWRSFSRGQERRMFDSDRLTLNISIQSRRRRRLLLFFFFPHSTPFWSFCPSFLISDFLGNPIYFESVGRINFFSFCLRCDGIRCRCVWNAFFLFDLLAFFELYFWFWYAAMLSSLREEWITQEGRKGKLGAQVSCFF